MTELPGDPLRVLAGREPERRCRVAHLVWPSQSQPEVPQQRVPDPFDEVLVVDRIALAVAEDVLRETARSLLLPAQRIEDKRGHLDLALRAVGLGVLVLSQHAGFADQDQPALEVDVLPLQSVDLAGAHAGEAAHQQVVAIVRPDLLNQHLDLLEREGLNVAAPDLQPLETGRRRNEPVPLTSFIEHLL